MRGARNGHRRARNPTWRWRVAYGTSWADPHVHEPSLLVLAQAEAYALEQGPSYRVGLRCARSRP